MKTILSSLLFITGSLQVSAQDCTEIYTYFPNLSNVDARRKFNADSAFTFTLHLRPADYYKKDFKHVKVLLIQRMGRGYAYICSFYTDKAKTKFDKYWRRIEKTLRYKD